MGLFKKKAPTAPKECPACAEPLNSGHCVTHTKEVPGGFIFVCQCGRSTMKWPNQDVAAMCMELHLDRDHGTAVSTFAGQHSILDNLYRETFPSGRAVQPH